MRDRSLDEFAADDAPETDAGESSDADRDATDAGDPVPGEGSEVADEDTGEAATATFEWSPTGVECATCGASVTRRWCSTEGAGLVCTDCKEW